MNRKWYYWGRIPMLYSIARLGVSFLFGGIAWLALTIEILDVYEIITWIAGPPILILSCIAMFADFRKLLKDCEGLAMRPEYDFFKFSGFMLIKCIVDVITAFVWEIGTLDLSNSIDMIKGVPFAGHASGAAIFTSIGCAILQMIVALIISGVMNHKYKK